MPRASQPKILPTKTGFTVACGDTQLASIEWHEIGEIVAFKRDRITTDLVCLQFTRNNDSASFIEINEDMAGFEDLIASLETLSGFRSDRRRAVIQPAFATRRA